MPHFQKLGVKRSDAAKIVKAVRQVLAERYDGGLGVVLTLSLARAVHERPPSAKAVAYIGLVQPRTIVKIAEYVRQGIGGRRSSETERQGRVRLRPRAAV